MRDARYIAIHRGGELSLERHRQLASWAADCAEHVLPFFSKLSPNDSRPLEAIELARAWSRGECKVGAARNASIAAHAAAREAEDPVACFVARAAGHAVATAHMADHAPGAAIYAIKALRVAQEIENLAEVLATEHEWQKAQLPEEIRELVESTFAVKFASMDL